MFNAKHSSFLLALLMLFTGIVAAEGRALVFGGTSFPPFFGKDMENGGPLVEIATQAFAVSGRQISVRWLPWKRVIAMNEEGSLDGITFAWYKPERDAFLYFGESIFPNQNGLFKRKGDPLDDLGDLSVLRGKKVGMVAGYSAPDSLLHSGAEFTEGTEDIKLLKMLAAKRVDYVYTDQQVGRYLLRINAPDIQNDVIWLATLQEFPNYLAISKQVKDVDPKLILKQWADGLKAIKESGQYDAILKKHHLIN